MIFMYKDMAGNDAEKRLEEMISESSFNENDILNATKKIKQICENHPYCFGCPFVKPRVAINSEESRCSLTGMPIHWDFSWMKGSDIYASDFNKGTKGSSKETEIGKNSKG